MVALAPLAPPALAEEGVRLTFSPARPVFHAEGTRQVGGQAIYGHSQFATTMTNTGPEPVRIESVILTSIGTGPRSGLGDIKDYWNYGNQDRRIGPGQSVQFNKTWGFTVDPQHDWLSYIFDVCWREAASGRRACARQTLDLVSEGTGASRTNP